VKKRSAYFFLAAFEAVFLAPVFLADDFLALDLDDDPFRAPEDFLPVVALAIMVSPDDRLSSSAGRNASKDAKVP
jgi:hypothetical protein